MNFLRLSTLVLVCLSAVSIFPQGLDRPILTIRNLAEGGIQLSWPASASNFLLEATDALSATAVWEPISETPVQQNNGFSVTIPPAQQRIFVRLRENAETGPATVSFTSPVEGETGVAVTRETIVYFSAPLGAGARLSNESFYASFGGRRILSRSELSSDRRKATLFYQEPLPGSARILVVFDGSFVTDETGQAIDADGDGQPGGQRVISFDTLSLTALGGTAVIGRVFASELVPGPDTGTNAVNQPLAGVTITVDGMEQTLRAVTDATGSFTLSPVPPGRFFVHIDGRTVTNLAAGIRYPDRAYYPSVGKAWTAVAGVATNLAGETGIIYLPLISADTLQTVSMAQDTTIAFPASVIAKNPALSGASITVPANSLFSDNGTRGGKVGIAAVPPDRLPSPLPPGVVMPLVVTVQTDGGLNFDRPVPVCFPNLPNPVTGKAWPSGTKGSLLSFNHDKGVWEEVGDMTVGADGKMFCTDPGFGILQPGWHGVLCPKGKKPPPAPTPPSDFRCDPSPRWLAACGLACANRNKKCLDEAEYILFYGANRCLDRSGGYSECISVVINYVKTLQRQCKWNRQGCDIVCDACRPTSSWPAFHPGQSGNSNLKALHGPLAVGDPLADQIASILDQILGLLEPFVSSHIEPPLNVINQITSLREQIDTLANGNGLAYLKNQLITAEENEAASAGDLGIAPEELNLGNAPPYPVLYAATVYRPSGIFILRGETQPFGQYSLFLPPDGELYNVSFYDPKTRSYGLITPNLSPKARYSLPRFDLLPLTPEEPDFDHDGLSDLVEEVYGTNPTQADTDGDGIPDGAEVEQNTNPLDGFVARTGIIATVRTPGAAVDVWTGNELVATAEGAGGVSIFNVYNGANPTMLAHVPTPGNVQRIAGSGNFIAAAAGAAGLFVIDATVPEAARIAHQVPFAGTAQALTAGGGIAYVGTSAGQVAAVDLLSGLIKATLTLPTSAAVQDLALEGDFLYALRGDQLHVISLGNNSLQLAGSVASPFVAAQNRRLFVGDAVAYTVHAKGYNTLDVSNAAKPALLGSGNTLQFGWKQIVANGSGLGLAAVGPNLSDDGPHDVGLYDLSNSRVNDVVITTFTTPGIARAVSIYNALAYVADDTSGLQVVNYLPYDAKNVAPTLSLVPGFSGSATEEGQPARVSAKVGDDVQVRNVEFYLDGVKAFVDGAFPFEFRFVAPTRNASKTTFTLRARAFDTGGNFTWSDEIVVTLHPDATPPRVTRVSPVGGGKTHSRILAFFNEPINPATLTSSSFRIQSAGIDGLFNTADDLPVNGGNATFASEAGAASLSVAQPLPDGLYRATLTTAVADFAGNRLAADYSWQFRVADAVFWIKLGDGIWTDPANWSGGVVPGPNDNVFIDLFPENVTVTHGGGTVQIRNLIVNERLELNGAFATVGVLQVSEGIQIGGAIAFNGGIIRGGTVTQKDGGRLVFGQGRGSLEGVNVHGDLDLTGTATRLLIRDGLTLDGTVRLNNGGAIGFAGVQTFNTGSIVFEGTSGILSIEGNATLTLGPAMVVRGKSGIIGQPVFIGGSNKLINQGLISANVAGGTLTINTTQFENQGRVETKNGGSLKMDSANWSSAGMIDVAGGALTIDGAWSNTGTINANNAAVVLNSEFTLANLGKFNRTGGTVTLRGSFAIIGALNLNGGTLALDNTTGPWILDGGIIRNGTVTQKDGGRLLFGQGRSTLDGVTVRGDLDLTGAASRLLIRNGLTLDGTVRLDNGGAIGFAGVQTFNTGNIFFEGTSGVLSIEGNSTLTLGPAMVVHGKSGIIGQPVFIGGSNKLINQGLISAGVAGGTLTINATQFENQGRVETKNGGSLKMDSANWSSAGMIDVAGGTLTIDGAWSNTGTMNAKDAAVILDSEFTLANLGQFNRTGGTVTLRGSFAIIGALNLNGGTLALDDTTGPWILNGGIIRGGTVTQTQGGKLLFGQGRSTLEGVTVQGDLDLTGAASRLLIRNGLTLDGTVRLDNGGAIGFAGVQTINSGSIVFQGTSGILSIEGNSTLTLGPQMVVRGKTGIIGQPVFIGGSNKLINQGLISADVAGGKLTINTTQFENTGTLEEKNGGKMVIVP